MSEVSLDAAVATDSDVASVALEMDVAGAVVTEDVVSTTTLVDEVAEEAGDGSILAAVSSPVLDAMDTIEFTPRLEAVGGARELDESLVVSTLEFWSPQPASKTNNAPATRRAVQHPALDLYIYSQVRELRLRLSDAGPKVAQVSAEDVGNREQHLRQDSVLITKVLVPFDDSTRLTSK